MTPTQKKRLEEELRQDTVILLDIIWAMSEQESMESLAQRSGLSVATLYRLWGGIWSRPQFLTIQKLALAVGLEIRLAKDGIRASLAD